MAKWKYKKKYAREHTSTISNIIIYYYFIWWLFKRESGFLCPCVAEDKLDLLISFCFNVKNIPTYVVGYIPGVQMRKDTAYIFGSFRRFEFPVRHKMATIKTIVFSTSG